MLYLPSVQRMVLDDRVQQLCGDDEVCTATIIGDALIVSKYCRPDFVLTAF